MIKMLIQSILVGFIIAVPIGPAAVMIIQRTLTRGRVYGIIAAIGAGIADTVFGGHRRFWSQLDSGLAYQLDRRNSPGWWPVLEYKRHYAAMRSNRKSDDSA